MTKNRSSHTQMAETSINGGPSFVARNGHHAAVGLSGGPAVPDYFAKILKNKDRIIRVQAKRIELLETEVERLRVARETISTQLALVSYKLELATSSSVPGTNTVSSDANPCRQDELLQTNVNLGNSSKYVRHLYRLVHISYRPLIVICQSVKSISGKNGLTSSWPSGGGVIPTTGLVHSAVQSLQCTVLAIFPVGTVVADTSLLGRKSKLL